MSRKAFLIWGLAFIQLAVTCSAVLMYLAFSKIIDAKAIGSSFGMLQMFIILIGFGVILHFRFKETGRRKRIWALCVPFYITSLVLASYLTFGYLMSDFFGAHERFFSAIGEWSRMEEPKPVSPWNVKQKLDYIFFVIPALYLNHWGLFALLAFGSLDPRKPSKNRVVQFFKTGLQRASVSAVKKGFTEVAHG